MKSLFVKNSCDGAYSSFDVHFTNICDNKCSHCIDLQYEGIKAKKTSVNDIVNTIVSNSEGVNDVLFLGGEPCLYLDELLDCITQLKEKTKLKLFITTAVPKTCYDNKETFYKILELVDGLNISVQHHNEAVADEIRKSHSKYDRQKFYNELPFKNKIRVNLNIVKPFLCTKEDLTDCIVHYDKMGFSQIKLTEIQNATEHFVSFEDIFGIKLKSPYFHGCQHFLDMKKIIPGIKTPVLLKRSCFFVEDTLNASFLDGIKALYRRYIPTNKKFGVIYEDGTLSNKWK